MSDGNTSIPVAPVLTEGEMNSFRELFSKIANTITEASSLKVEFEALRNQVTGLTNDLEYQRSRNTNLDEALINVRRERDEATRLLSEGRIEWEQAKRDLSKALEQVDLAEHVQNDLNTSLAQARKDRDEAQFTVLSLTEERDALKASLARISEAMQGVTVHVTQAAPTTMIGTSTEPDANLTRSEPVFLGEGHGFIPNAQAELTEDPKPAERRKVYRSDPDFDNKQWMNETNVNYYGFANDRDGSKEDWYSIPV